MTVSAHDAVASKDCATYGCTLEADPGSRFCRAHVPNEGDAMVCKVDGCTTQSSDVRGPYAYLCSTHKEEARARRSRSEPAALAPGTTLAAQARALVPLAAALDRSRAKLAGLPSSRAAKAAYDEAARRASERPTPENLARVTDAIRALQAGAPKRTKLETDSALAERTLGLALQSFVRATRDAGDA